jgi:O-6-methylguanine DNA methyltransferase
MKADTSFTERVLAVVKQIPAGTTLSYADVARRAGQPKAYRAVGNILNRIWQTDHGVTVPCHRVIRSSGAIGSYAGGETEKLRRLQVEQVTL